MNEPEIINEEEIGAVDNKVKKTKEKLEACQKEKAEYLAGWQRCQADFVNYRRRQEEQLAEWSKMFGAGLVVDLLPVLDTLDASIKNSGDGGSKAVCEQLFKVLQGHGLEEIKSVGKPFNPEWHEAMETIKTEDSEEGMIVEEILKGYMLNGKVLRVAKVKVNKNL